MHTGSLNLFQDNSIKPRRKKKKKGKKKNNHKKKRVTIFNIKLSNLIRHDIHIVLLHLEQDFIDQFCF